MLLGSPARVHAEVTMPTEHNTAHEISPARGRDRPVGMQTALHSCEEEHWRTAAPMESVSRPVALSARCDSARAHETVVDVPAFPSQPHLERRTRGSVFRNSETMTRIRRNPTRVSQFVFNEAEASLSNFDLKDKQLDSPTITPVKLSATMRFMLWCVDGLAGTVFMTMVTLWALFGDDLRLLTTERDMDSFFVQLTLFCLCCFVVELLFASIAKAGYFASFYFWLDCIATCSLVLDIPEVFEAFTGVSEKDSTLEYNDGDAMQGDAGNADAAKESATLTRAGRTSRAGTRAGRIVRLVRLVRILKLYKQYAKNKEKVADARGGKGDDEHDTTQELEESRVGQKLSDLTTRRVILGVLLMLFILPLFDASTFDEHATLMSGGFEMVVQAYMVSNDTKDDGFLNAMDTYVQHTTGIFWINIMGTSFNDRYNLAGPQYRPLRGTEFDDVSLTLAGEVSYAKFDLSEVSKVQALLNIMRTLFICLVLGLGSLLFSRDANMLVLIPIERMMKKVKDLAENPLSRQDFGPTDSGEQFETKILENSFAKICSLMAVGFGEAGAEIIAENLRNGGELDPMIPGKRMVAIFGFCDIRQFTDATEVLQEGVMEFVNTIAKIVHMEVALHGGSANKNIGDAFLLVWKFDPDCSLRDVAYLSKGLEMKHKGAAKDMADALSKRQRIQRVADQALASMVVIMAMLKKSARLRSYSNMPALVARIPNFEVKMGFGLHVGWAIEGAIGSEYKVDASYLSPNVNMAARLEAATKQFRTPLLMTQDMANILTPGTRAMCRQIDRVTVKGSTQPVGLFTYDMDVERLHVNWEDSIFNQSPTQFTASTMSYTNEFEQHPDITSTRAWTPEFLEAFRQAYQAYESGQWAQAKELLERTKLMRRDVNGQPVEDGPSVSLLHVLAAHNFTAPDGWQGCRELTEK